jgi:hypothetical protein
MRGRLRTRPSRSAAGDCLAANHSSAIDGARDRSPCRQCDSATTIARDTKAIVPDPAANARYGPICPEQAELGLLIRTWNGEVLASGVTRCLVHTSATVRTPDAHPTPVGRRARRHSSCSGAEPRGSGDDPAPPPRKGKRHLGGAHPAGLHTPIEGRDRGLHDRARSCPFGRPCARFPVLECCVAACVSGWRSDGEVRAAARLVMTQLCPRRGSRPRALAPRFRRSVGAESRRR